MSDDFNREFIKRVNQLCVEAIQKGNNNIEYHAVVMLYAKLNEMEMGLELCKQTIDSLLHQIKNPMSENYKLMLEGEDEQQE